MKRNLLATAACWLALFTGASAACCYFAAMDKDVNQPGQRAFITWDEDAQIESFTVQPTFEGNAQDFGMVIPTPTRPKLQEMPKDFFKSLAVFTILEPIDWSRFQQPPMTSAKMENAPSAARAGGGPPPVRVLEAGTVGSLDYKLLEADKADALYVWLKENHYTYKGDQKTLDFYIQKKWNFTVMKIDPRQMKKKADGSYLGEVTPTRFTFKVPKPIYPLRITKLSVKDQTDALFYVMARQKMDLGGDWSYENNFLTMWSQGMSMAIPEKMTASEKQWVKVVAKRFPNQPVSYHGRPGPQPVGVGGPGANLEWAGKLTADRLAVLTGKKKYSRQAPPEDIKKLAILQGHLKQDWFLTKFRKVFKKDEMSDDLALVPAKIGQANDDIEYIALLPNPSGFAPP